MVYMSLRLPPCALEPLRICTWYYPAAPPESFQAGCRAQHASCVTSTTCFPLRVAHFATAISNAAVRASNALNACITTGVSASQSTSSHTPQQVLPVTSTTSLLLLLPAALLPAAPTPASGASRVITALFCSCNVRGANLSALLHVHSHQKGFCTSAAAISTHANCKTALQQLSA